MHVILTLFIQSSYVEINRFYLNKIVGKNILKKMPLERVSLYSPAIYICSSPATLLDARITFKFFCTVYF